MFTVTYLALKTESLSTSHTLCSFTLCKHSSFSALLDDLSYTSSNQSTQFHHSYRKTAFLGPLLYPELLTNQGLLDNTS